MKKLITLAAMICALNFPLMAFANADGPSAPLEHALSKLPAEKAENFRDAMQQAHEENKDLYEQAHQLREQMHKLLTADTFDANAFTAKSEELRQVHDKIAANLDNAFAQAASDLSPGERKKLAHALEHAHKEQQAMKKTDSTQQ